MSFLFKGQPFNANNNGIAFRKTKLSPPRVNLHKPVEMPKKCAEEGCAVRANFGYKGGSMTHCAGCSKRYEGMVSLKKQKQCAEEGNEPGTGSRAAR